MLLLSAAPAVAQTVHAAKTPDAIGREAVAVLAARASDPDHEVRAAVAAEWGLLGNRVAIPLLKRAIRDPKSDVRAAAAVSLRQLGDIQGLTALIDETKAAAVSGPAGSPAEELRRMAGNAARARATSKLGEIGGEAALEALTNLLSDPSGEVRDAAAVALARLGRFEPGPFLDALKDPDEGVRASAAKSLGLIGRAGVDPLRRALSSDSSTDVRAEAAAALGSFRSDPASLKLLTQALQDKNVRVRRAALRALARRDEADSTSALKSLLSKSPPPEEALVAVAALAARGVETDLDLPELTLGHRDPELKALAVAALASSKNPRAVDLLVKTMREDPQAHIRVRAAAALVARLRSVGAPP